MKSNTGRLSAWLVLALMTVVVVFMMLVLSSHSGVNSFYIWALIAIEVFLLALLLFERVRGGTGGYRQQNLRQQEIANGARLAGSIGGLFFAGLLLFTEFRLHDSPWGDLYFWAALVAALCLAIVPVLLIFRDKRY